MRNSILFSSFVLAVAVSLPVAAQTGHTSVSGAPGVSTAMQSHTVEATITKIDAKTREVTLKGPEGREITIVAGPEVKNFSQLKVGNKVETEYVEALVLDLKKGGGQQVVRTERSVRETAKPGETPRAAAGREIKVVGDVTKLDPATRTVTVRGPHRTVDLHIEDPEQFKLIAKGDQIQATYLEAVGVSVVAAKKK